MTKIMLVEDDKSLREIYGVRLLAEGYDIVSAGDGEEALAVAIKDRPALIITDIMMPKISGFDMLDILRSTTETKNIKVIVMTALGSDDQRARGEQLGADRYLVKSQVGIEDVVRTVHEVLNDKPTTSPTETPTVNTQPTISRPAGPMAPPPTRQAVPLQPAPLEPAATPSSTAPTPPSIRNRVIQPINDPSARVNINELLDKELAKEAGIDVNNRPPVATTAQEKAVVDSQLTNFSGKPTNIVPSAPVTTQAVAQNPQVTSSKQPTIQIDAQGNVAMPDTSATQTTAQPAPVAPAPTAPPTPNSTPPTPPPPVR